MSRTVTHEEGEPLTSGCNRNKGRKTGKQFERRRDACRGRGRQAGTLLAATATAMTAYESASECEFSGRFPCSSSFCRLNGKNSKTCLSLSLLIRASFTSCMLGYFSSIIDESRYDNEWPAKAAEIAQSFLYPGTERKRIEKRSSER